MHHRQERGREGGNNSEELEAGKERAGARVAGYREGGVARAEASR